MNYNDTAMAGISEADYETLVVHLTEQVAACITGADSDETLK
jgi:hypothetical protein